MAGFYLVVIRLVFIPRILHVVPAKAGIHSWFNAYVP
jgi:hypothetical protein